uniref:Uncharacterized protein n=1 Tax=Romanomermis culicivorax TaxID=13658 RepID=A0A915KHR3_ROMCU
MEDYTDYQSICASFSFCVAGFDIKLSPSPRKCLLLNTYLGTIGRASDQYAARILAVKSVFISRHVLRMHLW